jgi:exopolysaccharide biosynthesis protein
MADLNEETAMKNLWRWGGLVGIISVSAFVIFPGQKRTSNLSSAQNISIEYKVINTPASVAYTLTIPQGSGTIIRPYISETLETIAAIGKKTGATAAINAGFFDPVNQKTTSRIVVDRQEVASPRNNERLMNNPKLSSYLGTILNRSEFRQYLCGSQTRYDIVARSSPSPAGCVLEQAIAGGPQLLPSNTAQQEGFTDYKNGELIRDAIGTTQRNARTAIGITDTDSVVWVTIAQKPNRSGESGMTLAELEAFLKGLGVKKALNLDGGSSSSIYFKEQAHYGKLNEDGQFVPRPVKSAFILKTTSQSSYPK